MRSVSNIMLCRHVDIRINNDKYQQVLFRAFSLFSAITTINLFKLDQNYAMLLNVVVDLWSVVFDVQSSIAVNLERKIGERKIIGSFRGVV